MKNRIFAVVITLFFTLFEHILSAEQAFTYESWMAKGYEYVQKGKYEDAITCYKMALNDSTDNPEIYYNLGVVYGENGMWEKAILEYEKVLRLNPEHMNGRYNLGIAYGNIGEWDSAFKTFTKLIQLQPKDADAHYNLALIGIILNNKKAVTKEYKILKEISLRLAKKIQNDFNI